MSWDKPKAQSPVDPEQDKADMDWVYNLVRENALGATDRRLWMVYESLYNLGFRIDRAKHEIAKLAPRKAS